MTDFRPIDIDTLDKLLEDHETVLVEVLPDEAYQKGHIPGAINIPVDSQSFDEEFQQTVPEHNTPVVVYCASTDCDASPRAAKRLVDLGYEHVYDYQAGKKGWRQAGRGLEKRVHEVQETL